MKQIHAKDLESAAKLVDMIYRSINPRVGEWLREGPFMSCNLRNGRHIYIQDTLRGLMLYENDPEYNESV